MLGAVSRSVLPEVVSDERALIAHLSEAVGRAGIQVDAVPLINYYVALKSKPLTILAGPADSGKIAVAESLGHLLTGGARLQYQRLVGHPWWASQSESVALCTTAQSQLNASKILALAEEAIQPENGSRVYLACLARISPAEVVGLLEEIALQFRAGRLVSLSGLSLVNPIRFPANLWLTATVDTDRSGWASAQTFSHATAVYWPAVASRSGELRRPASQLVGAEQLFLRACIRDTRAARRKLRRVLGAWPAAFSALAQVTAVLRNIREGIASFLGDVLVFLANAWTNTGHGLFDAAPKGNLAIATDLALAQLLLPRLTLSPSLRRQLRSLLVGSQYSIAAAALESFS